MTLKELREKSNEQDILILDEIYVCDGEEKEWGSLCEGQWISGRFDKNIRLDRATHGAGQDHAHIYGRKGNQLGVVNIDGTGSHGTKMKISKKDADAICTRNYKIPTNRIIEWVELHYPQVLTE